MSIMMPHLIASDTSLHTISYLMYRPGTWRQEGVQFQFSSSILQCLQASLNTKRNRPLASVFMMTSSNGNIFRVTGHLCGKFTGHLWIPRTKASDTELWRFLLRRNERLSQQSGRRWFETQSCPLWCHSNVVKNDDDCTRIRHNDKDGF